MLEEMNMTTAIAVIVGGLISWFLKGRVPSPAPGPAPMPMPDAQHRPIAEAILLALGMAPEQRAALKAMLDALNVPAPLGALPLEKHR